MCSEPALPAHRGPAVTEARTAPLARAAGGRGGPVLASGAAVVGAISARGRHRVVVVVVAADRAAGLVGLAALVGEIIDDCGVRALGSIAREQRLFVLRHDASLPVVPGTVADAISRVDRRGAQEGMPALGAGA